MLWNVFRVLQRGHLISIRLKPSVLANNLKQYWHFKFCIYFSALEKLTKYYKKYRKRTNICSFNLK
ncbi:hypothetical protein PA3_26510 [Acinetobacter pittii]|uniref:Uncharacterized protein n=1 Tax=Acinetobacter pittii TaxID=48296 RepID=A0A4Y3J9L2_ACIPI|nr:hypothetical protein PA3_26510 [Acinetobacter pittii]